jgi:hypothetical protein
MGVFDAGRDRSDEFVVCGRRGIEFVVRGVRVHVVVGYKGSERTESEGGKGVVSVESEAKKGREKRKK